MVVAYLQAGQVRGEQQTPEARAKAASQCLRSAASILANIAMTYRPVPVDRQKSGAEPVPSQLIAAVPEFPA